MSYNFYKWVHLTSLMIMFLSTGFLLASAFIADFSPKLRKKISAIHGVALLAAFVAGFGLLARLGHPSPFTTGWMWIKIFAWLGFGMLPLFLKRGPEALKKNLFIIYSLLIVIVVYTVINKPF